MKNLNSNFFKFLKRKKDFIISLIFMSFFLNACAYRWGLAERTLPGGYKHVYVPIFKNYSSEPELETYFTNAMREEIERSKIARLSEYQQSEVELKGEILNVNYVASAPTPLYERPVDKDIQLQLSGSYTINVVVKISLIRRSDQKVLWSGEFNSQKNYSAPQVSTAGVNSVNPLYNLSARRQNIQVMSLVMMAEAHDRLTENF